MNTLRGLTIGIIGAGKMGQALIQGLLAHGLPPRALSAADPSGAARRAVSRRFRIRVTSRNRGVVQRSDVVVLAVKPQQFPELMAEIASALSPRPRHQAHRARGRDVAPHRGVTQGTRGSARGAPQLVISIAAGIRLRWLETRLPGIPLVRAMPNLTATVARGFSAIALGRRATARHRTIAESVFGAVGEVVELPERCFDAITAVSGSGPAYVFFLVRMWEAAARSLGLPKAVAERAIRQTLKGSVRLLEASGEPPAALLAKVASKGGTTEAALARLAKRRVAEHFREALRAAANRSKALSF
jgi:pyrroline-5-carboxylate reductase